MKTQDFTEPRANPPVRAALALIAALSASVLISGCNKPVDEQAPPLAETAPPAETPPLAETPPSTDPAVPAPTDSTTTPPSEPTAEPTPTDSDSTPKN